MQMEEYKYVKARNANNSSGTWFVSYNNDNTNMNNSTGIRSRIDEEDASVVEFFDILLGLNLIFAIVGSLLCFILVGSGMNKQYPSNTDLIPLLYIIPIWFVYVVDKFFILAIKGIFRNISIMRWNSSKELNDRQKQND